MELIEHEIIEKYAKCCMLCRRYTLLPYEDEWSCIACGQNLKKNKT